MPVDPFAAHARGLDSPSLTPFPIVPDNGNDLPGGVVARAIIVHTAGDVKIRRTDGTDVTLTLPAGLFPIQFIRVHATGTTATGLTALP